jgi:hypothetical protein
MTLNCQPALHGSERSGREYETGGETIRRLYQTGSRLRLDQADTHTRGASRSQAATASPTSHQKPPFERVNPYNPSGNPLENGREDAQAPPLSLPCKSRLTQCAARYTLAAL